MPKPIIRKQNKKKVRDVSYLRDPHSKALVSTDRTGLEAYRKRSAALDQVQHNTDTLDNLVGEISDVKKLMTTILKKLDSLE